MQTLLHIQSSLFGNEGQSSRLASEFTEQWLRQHPGARVIHRDLAAEPVPHLDLARFQAFTTSAPERTAAQQEVDAYSLALIQELQAADVIVLGVPMYNFSIPSQLHTWFDHVARGGITFRHSEAGPEGLLKDKQAHVFITRGGVYGEGHVQTQYLRQFLGFLGIEDLRFVHAEGLALAKLRNDSLAQARRSIDSLLAA
jgi:FMN-dependent NADH-azoreductase